MEYNAQDIFVVNPKARLRNEGKYVIAAFPDPSAVPLFPLAQIEAVTISLFDGDRSCAEVQDICSSMVDSASSDPMLDAEKAMRLFVERHTEPIEGMPAPLLRRMQDLTTEEKRNIVNYTPTDYIVSNQEFNPKDLKLSFPVSILWLLTNDCQVNCQYCYMPKTDFKKSETLPLERLKELFEEGKGKGVMANFISGGDPLCHPDIFDILDILDESGFPPISIPTKAYISPKIAKRLAGYRILEDLQLSIDSTVPEIADFLVASPGFYERTIESIKNARAAGVRIIKTKTVITPYNLPTLPKLYRDLKALGVDKITLATYCKSGFRHREKLFNYADDYLWLDEQLDKLRSEFPDDEISYQNGAPQIEQLSQEERDKSWSRRARCTAGRENITVCANGRVIACEQMPEQEEDYLGDLTVQSIEEVWNSKVMDEYLFHPPREKFAGTPCFDCEEYDECQSYVGQCVRNSYIHYGTRWYPPVECPRVPTPVPRNF